MVDAAVVLPALAFPSLMTCLAGSGHGMEFPNLFTRASIVCTRIAWRTFGGFFWNIGADDQEVFIHSGRGVVSHHHFHDALITNTVYGFARSCTERDQFWSGCKKDPG